MTEIYEIKNCEVTEMDKLVKSGIVSGYVAIFCCRTRPTQDVDIIFHPYSKEAVFKLIRELEEK